MLFLGPLFERSEENGIKDKTVNGKLQNQANTFQWNCIEGFEENGETVSIINVLPVGVFPKQYKSLVLSDRKWTYNNKTINTEIGAINLPVVKQVMREIKVRKAVRMYDDDTIVIYSTYLPFLRAARKIKSSKKIVLIVPDLPQFYDYSATMSLGKRVARALNTKFIYKTLKRVDGFVLLTEAMKEPLGVGTRPYVIVEGMVGSSEEDIITQTKANKEIKNILYTGSLNSFFGIDSLVKAFMLTTNENYRLQICGGGNYEEALREAQRKDSRIEYKGYVTRDEAIRLQRQATVLVNPRSNNGEYTKYSFPSKTMEYLQSGVPVIAYKLSGIPDEYAAYINYAEEETIEALKNSIEKVCNDESGFYKKKAKQAKEFVEREKSKAAQTKKIIELIDVLKKK